MGNTHNIGIGGFQPGRNVQGWITGFGRGDAQVRAS